MKAIKIIRITTKDERYKRFIDYFIFNNKDGVINIGHATRYLDLKEPGFWQLIEDFERDFREFFTCEYQIKSSNISPTFLIKEKAEYHAVEKTEEEKTEKEKTPEEEPQIRKARKLTGEIRI